MWYVYLLRCADATLYCGVTTDMERRLREHNAGSRGAKYTRARRPVELVCCVAQPDASSACHAERETLPGKGRSTSMLMGMMIIVGFIVGFLVGCTGMGGIILIPALVYLSGLSSHVAMGTTLFTFIFTTSLCSWLYIRRGHVDWKATIPICIGGFLFT